MLWRLRDKGQILAYILKGHLYHSMPLWMILHRHDFLLVFADLPPKQRQCCHDYTVPWPKSPLGAKRQSRPWWRTESKPGSWLERKWISLNVIFSIYLVLITYGWNVEQEEKYHAECVVNTGEEAPDNALRNGIHDFDAKLEEYRPGWIS